MPAIQRLIQPSAPGVYVNQGTYGAIPQPIATHDTVYVMGTCSSANVPFNTPVFISNTEDFTNRVGSSPSSAAVKSFFDQKSGKGLFFVNVSKRVQRTVVGATFVAGTVATLTINGTPISYTLGAGETAASVGRAICLTAATQLAGVVQYRNGVLTSNPSDTITGNAVLTVSAASAVGSYPTATDVADSANLAFVPENSQGFLVAPEFYQNYSSQTDRHILQRELDAFCAQPVFYWIHLVDCGASTATVANGNGAIDAMRREFEGYVSPLGSSSCYFPYLRTNTNVLIPASLACLGAGLRRAREEGIFQPFAGTQYPLYGVQDTSFNVTALGQGVLNPLGINCVRSLPNKGICCYGARTLSTNPYYIFMTTRLILNVVAGSLRSAYADTPFRLVDGESALFNRIKATADNVCEQVRKAGGLFGATPAEAYLNVCDATNNPPAQLERGVTALDSIVKVSPVLEALVIGLSVTSLGTVLAQVGSAGETSAIEATTNANGK